MSYNASNYSAGPSTPLSYSVGPSTLTIEKGIVVVCAAGNSGPDAATMYNAAPWIMTVGAGTIDRNFVATLELGNGLKFKGTSYFPSSVSITDTDIYYEFSDPRKSGCSVLDPIEVNGKVILCDDSINSDAKEKMNVVTIAGAYGAIILSTECLTSDPFDYSIPAICLHTRFAKEIKEYSKEVNASVTTMRFVFTETGTRPAPQVASLSSRGPDPVTPNNVLKPDILAPAGVAALVKAVHHDWSPAAIRSAIMTTATIVDNTGTTIQDQANGLAATPLDYGAGHVNPNRAMDPGLIFDLGSQDYIDFLCDQGYTDKQMTTVIRKSRWVCNENKTDLNYPSFIVSFTNKSTFPFEKHFTRTVTNVGEPTSSYRAIVEVPDGMIVRVEPNTMQFTSKYQKQKFVLSLQADGNAAPKVKYGYLKWVDGHNHIITTNGVVPKSFNPEDAFVHPRTFKNRTSYFKMIQSQVLPASQGLPSVKNRNLRFRRVLRLAEKLPRKCTEEIKPEDAANIERIKDGVRARLFGTSSCSN
ncbi:Peptidase S8/S53 domain-containing protein [Artemisia annua]|uniref:Peptidase S8/S53 domain-containing protein n=1 Tax=Artemisia annua TaxID=35608 RepID=A0A2U1MC96_ARTAN|nr:Peptidase S8/S53 domain-containing protein [Artemisia annua]